MFHLGHAFVAGITCLCSSVAVAADFQILTNGGFETGNLSGWTSTLGLGHVVSVSAGEPPCVRIVPNVPRSGSFLFSSSIHDGAVPNTPEITIHQAIDVSGFPGIAAGGASIDALGYFAGADGCTVQDPSEDLAQIVVEFRDGGPGGALLGTAVSAPLDPVPGNWNPLGITGPVPAATDTIVVRVRTTLDPGHASIDMGVDDLSLVLSVPETPDAVPAAGASWLGALAAALLGATAIQFRRR